MRSEPFIVAGLAKATLPANPKVDWDRWLGDYSLVRDAIEATYPDQFKDFNKRMFTPGGFRPLAARERKWKTPNGKSNFTVPETLSEPAGDAPGIYRLLTVRADGQFNTTVYNENDRFRGVEGGRRVVLMNEADMAQLNLWIGAERGPLKHCQQVLVANDGLCLAVGSQSAPIVTPPRRLYVVTSNAILTIAAAAGSLRRFTSGPP